MRRARFICRRQRPTDPVDEFEEVGAIDFLAFTEIFREIDWRREANQAKWANRSLPGVSVTNDSDGCVMWVTAQIAESVVDPETLPEGIPEGDRYEPWFFIGMNNPPDIPHVTALNARGDDDQPGFMTFTLEPIEECFQWFFEEDYVSLYEHFRWI